MVSKGISRDTAHRDLPRGRARQGATEVEEPSADGAIARPGLDIAYEVRLLPKRLPNWMGGPSGGILEALLQVLVVALVGDRWGVKMIVFRVFCV